jgi:hypothetical protein
MVLEKEQKQKVVEEFWLEEEKRKENGSLLKTQI